MDMRIDGQLVRAEREKRAWSQEHLANAAGIGARTVQRIEASGVASYESARAVSAALEIPLNALRREEPLLQTDMAAGSASTGVTLATPWRPASMRSAAGWLGVVVALVILAGAGGFLLLHDYQKVRVLRTFEHWVTDAN